MEIRVLSVALASAVYLSGCGGQDNPTVEVHKEETPKTVGYKVAAIDEGGYIAPDDIKVVRVEYLLRDISKKSGRNEEVIADQTAKTME